MGSACRYEKSAASSQGADDDPARRAAGLSGSHSHPHHPNDGDYPAAARIHSEPLILMLDTSGRMDLASPVAGGRCFQSSPVIHVAPPAQLPTADHPDFPSFRSQTRSQMHLMPGVGSSLRGSTTIPACSPKLQELLPVSALELYGLCSAESYEETRTSD